MSEHEQDTTIARDDFNQRMNRDASTETARAAYQLVVLERIETDRDPEVGHSN